MPAALRTSLLGRTPLLLMALTAACERAESRTETAGATVPAAAGTVPVTTASDEARRIYLQGRTLTENLRAHDGRKLYEKAVATDPGFAMAHYQLAVNSGIAKDFFDHLKHAVELSGKTSEGERLMILALEAGGNAQPARAREPLAELVAKYPDDERAHFLLGGAHFGQLEYDKAAEQYQTATRLNPQYAPAYNLLGYTYRQLDRFDEAETAFKKYIELIPEDPNPYDSYAELLMRTGRFEESMVQYRRALDLDSNFTPSRVGIANDLMLQGKHKEALATLDDLYRRARDDGERRQALFVKGVVLVDAGKHAAAVQEIEKEFAIARKAGDSANMSGDVQLIGDIQLAAGRTEEAAKRYGQALALVEQSSLPDEVKTDTRLADRYNRARIALAKGDVETARTEAKAYLEGAESRKNSFRIWQAHELAGSIALKEKKYDDAIAHLGQANQQNPQVVYWTALAHKGKGDGAKAKELAAKAAEANVLPQAAYAFVRVDAGRLSRS
ncbi:MAG TPA: tetratricopeptide repeat protein [Gemmatimonadales bacterium]|nr:tetratricopeptide repeat protein [Gemmatimonadales bacterium]